MMFGWSELVVNFAFYSDQIIPENRAIDQKLLAMMASNGVGRRIGYVPTGPEPDRRFFRERADYYARHGLELRTFYDLDEAHTGDVGQHPDGLLLQALGGISRSSFTQQAKLLRQLPTPSLRLMVLLALSVNCR